ncbi:MAG: hypothetical protein ACFNS8_03385, partial [Kingella oralis]
FLYLACYSGIIHPSSSSKNSVKFSSIMIILQVMNERMNERLPKFFLRRRSVLALIFLLPSVSAKCLPINSTLGIDGFQAAS